VPGRIRGRPGNFRSATSVPGPTASFDPSPQKSGLGRGGRRCSISVAWRQITRMRDHLAHRYFDTAHAILQATVDEDLPELERAVQALTLSVEKEDPDTRTGTT
jgi:Ribonuclease HepT-like